MKIIFFDRSEIVVSKKQWQDIKRLRGQGKTWIELKALNIEFDPRSIAKVVNGGITEADLPINPLPVSQRLNSDSRSVDERWESGRDKIKSIREVIDTKGFRGLKKS